MNIEKTFISKISSTYPGCESVVYSLMEQDCLSIGAMEKYLIRTEFKEIIEKDGSISRMQTYSDLGEKYCKGMEDIRWIIRNK